MSDLRVVDDSGARLFAAEEDAMTIVVNEVLNVFRRMNFSVSLSELDKSLPISFRGGSHLYELMQEFEALGLVYKATPSRWATTPAQRDLLTVIYFSRTKASWSCCFITDLNLRNAIEVGAVSR